MAPPTCRMPQEHPLWDGAADSHGGASTRLAVYLQAAVTASTNPQPTLTPTSPKAAGPVCRSSSRRSNMALPFDHGVASSTSFNSGSACLTSTATNLLLGPPTVRSPAPDTTSNISFQSMAAAAAAPIPAAGHLLCGGGGCGHAVAAHGGQAQAASLQHTFAGIQARPVLLLACMLAAIVGTTLLTTGPWTAAPLLGSGSGVVGVRSSSGLAPALARNLGQTGSKHPSHSTSKMVPPPAPSPSLYQELGEAGKQLNGAEIAGIVLGSVVAAVALGGLLFLFIRCLINACRRSGAAAAYDGADNPYLHMPGGKAPGPIAESTLPVSAAAPGAALGSGGTPAGSSSAAPPPAEVQLATRELGTTMSHGGPLSRAQLTAISITLARGVSNACSEMSQMTDIDLHSDSLSLSRQPSTHFGNFGLAGQGSFIGSRPPSLAFMQSFHGSSHFGAPSPLGSAPSLAVETPGHGGATASPTGSSHAGSNTAPAGTAPAAVTGPPPADQASSLADGITFNTTPGRGRSAVDRAASANAPPLSSAAPRSRMDRYGQLTLAEESLIAAAATADLSPTVFTEQYRFGGQAGSGNSGGSGSSGLPPDWPALSPVAVQAAAAKRRGDAAAGTAGSGTAPASPLASASPQPPSPTSSEAPLHLAMQSYRRAFHSGQQGAMTPGALGIPPTGRSRRASQVSFAPGPMSDVSTTPMTPITPQSPLPAPPWMQAGAAGAAPNV